jgi:sterol 3beta-glucosyltransferase
MKPGCQIASRCSCRRRRRPEAAVGHAPHTGCMRIALLAAGSRGDYQPLVAVGRALAERGHDVGVTATTDYVDLVHAGGLRAEEVRMDLMRRYRDEVLAGDGMPAGLHGQLGMIGEMARVLAPEVRRTMRELTPRYDGFVTTALTATWPSLFGDGRRRPQVLMMFVPALPSRWGDSSLFSVVPGRSLANLVAGLRGVRSAMGAVGPGAEPGTAGIRPRDRRRAALRMATTPAFVASTPHLVTPRRVAGREVRVVGYPYLDTPPGTMLPAEVDAFLSTGPPPVFAGLGSHTLPAVRDALRSTVDAALDLGRRVLVMRGSGLEDERGYDERVAFVGDVPHDLLFPRTAAVVHHGGAGTSAVALRAGRPQVPVPFTMDQPWFARRLHEIGVAAAPVPADVAGGPSGRERMRAALSQALAPEVVDRARLVAEEVRLEDGVAGAVAEIEAALLRS